MCLRSLSPIAVPDLVLRSLSPIAVSHHCLRLLPPISASDRAASSQVTDHMFASAAERLADYVTPEQISAGQLYPNLSELRNISLKVCPPKAP